MADIQEIRAQARALGEALGRSLDAIEHWPTAEQEHAAQVAVIASFPFLSRRTDTHWWYMLAPSFRDGYAVGKADPVGARARVEHACANAAIARGRRPDRCRGVR